MKKIVLVCAGKLKERYWREACAEYEKRLSAYCALTIREVKDEPAKDNGTEAETRRVLEREGERILQQIPARAHCVALTIDGKAYDSLAFAEHLSQLERTADGAVVFVIGASCGLSEQVLARADERVSLSGLTYPHQMARVILLEQIYRAYRIRNGEPYHK